MIQLKNVIILILVLFIGGCSSESEQYIFSDLDFLSDIGNLTLNNSLFFQGGSEITDNSSCLILKSPNASDRIEICDNNTIKMFAGDTAVYFINTSDSFFFNTLTGDGSGLINVPFNDSDTNASLWILDMNNQILPKDFGRTLFTNDIIINSSSSLIIGGIENGNAFATISATNESPFNESIRTSLSFDRSILLLEDYNGTVYIVSRNNNTDPLSNNAIVAANEIGDSIYFNKWTENYEDKSLGQVVNTAGDMEIIIRRNNLLVKSILNGGTHSFSGENIFKVGFFDETNLSADISVRGHLGKDIMFTISDTNITSIIPHHIQDTLYFNATYKFNGNASPESPPLVTDKFAMFGRDDNNIYVKRPNGQIKRISLVGSGSSVFSEVTKFNNHSYFYGNIYLNNSVYNGVGVGYACIDAIGRLFKSSTACDTTLETFTRGNISDSTMGDE